MSKTVRRLILVSIIALLSTQLNFGGIADADPPRPAIAEGAWSWFGDPRAVRFNGATYLGWINRSGSVGVASIPDGGGVSASTLLKTAMEVDDHDNPSLLVRDSDSKILAFYSPHDGTNMYLRISSNAEDVSVFASEVGLDASLGGNNYTYPIPIQLTGETNDPIWLFYRDRDAGFTEAQWAYTKSEDGGATWAARTVFYKNTGQGAYLKAVPNGTTRVDFAVTDGIPSAMQSSIYHFYYSGGSFYQTDGTLISASLPLAPSDLTLVYDGTTNESWIWDIAIDGSGHPVIVYVAFPDAATDHRYRYARWNGSAWTDYEIAAAGGPIPDGTGTYNPIQYAGGVVLDHANVDRVFASREINGVHEIWQYDTANSGATWTGQAITQNSKHNQFRPVVPRGHGGKIDVLWIGGPYADWLDYETNIYSASSK